MNLANCETFHPRNFCRLRYSYDCKYWLFISLEEAALLSKIKMVLLKIRLLYHTYSDSEVSISKIKSFDDMWCRQQSSSQLHTSLLPDTAGNGTVNAQVFFANFMLLNGWLFLWSIISHIKYPANRLYHNRLQRHLVPISMFWSSTTNSQHSLTLSKHSLLMTRDSIVFSVKHKLQQCHNGNNSILASIWWILLSNVNESGQWYNNIMALASPCTHENFSC